MSIFIAKGNAQRAELIGVAAIETHIFAQRFKNKVALCVGKGSFFRHDAIKACTIDRRGDFLPFLAFFGPRPFLPRLAAL